jgi:hypothetical protein
MKICYGSNNVKNSLKVIIVTLFAFVLVTLMLPGTISAAASPSSIYPASIDGLPVILVETSANNVSLQNGKVILVLLDTASATPTESASKIDISDYLSNNPLPNNWSLEIYGGPGQTAEQIINLQTENNNLQKQYGVVTLGPPQSALYQSSVSPSVVSNFACDENDDPLNTSKLLNYQSCMIVAPITNYPSDINGYAYFGDNVITNAANPFPDQKGVISGNYTLQSGQYYQLNNNHLCYAYSNDGLSVHYFSLPYIPNDTYFHEVYYSNYELNGYSVWMMNCTNETTHQWVYIPQSYALGTYFIQSQNWNQGVFFENHFNDSDWYTAFNQNNPPNPQNTVYAYDAFEGYGSVINGGWSGTMSAWSLDTRSDPNQMKGSLESYGKTIWYLSYIGPN